MALFKVYRGQSTALDSVSKVDGHAYFCTDDGSFWIDYKTTDENGKEVINRKSVNENILSELIEKNNNTFRIAQENQAQLATILKDAPAEINSFTEVLDYIDVAIENIQNEIVNKTNYLGTINNIEELSLIAKPGDYHRVATEFNFGDEKAHVGDILIALVNLPSQNNECWDLIHTEMDKDTWTKNTKYNSGYVDKGENQINKVWGTDEEGNPTWVDGIFSLNIKNGEGNFSIVQKVDPEKTANVASGKHSVALGKGNTVTKDESLALGDGNTVEGGNSAAVCYHNTVTSDGAFAAGEYNEVSGESAIAVGYDNTVSGTASFAGNGKNTVTSDYAAAFGDSNTVGGYAGFASGQNNTITVQRGFVAGYANTASAADATVFGENNIANARAQTVVGKWNEENQSALFIVGRGTDETYRRNALEVLNDGRLRSSLTDSATSAEKNDKDILTRKEVMSEISDSSNSKVSTANAIAGLYTIYGKRKLATEGELYPEFENGEECVFRGDYYPNAFTDFEKGDRRVVMYGKKGTFSVDMAEDRGDTPEDKHVVNRKFVEDNYVKRVNPDEIGRSYVYRTYNHGGGKYTYDTVKATPASDQYTLMERDSGGRASVEAPTADKHIANKAYVDALEQRVATLEAKLNTTVDSDFFNSLY